MAESFKAGYGLDLSAGRMVLARCAPRGVPQVVLSADRGAEESIRLLKSVDLEVEKGAAALAICAPAAQTAIRRLRAPFASPRKAAKVWASLLDVDLPFPVESAVCSYGPPRIDQGGAVTIAAAIRKSDLAALGDSCRAAGFDPTHCDAEALALWDQQTADAPPARAEIPRALVWLGFDHVTIVRGRGSEFMAAHVVRTSSLSGDPQAFEAAWAARARQVIAAHLAETDGSEMDLWWAGPGAEDEARLTRLRRVLPAEFALRHETHRQPASFLARALARRAAEGEGVNFRSGDDEHPALRRMRERKSRWACGSVMAASLLVLALNFGESVFRRQRIESAQRELTAAAQAIAGEAIPRGQESLMVERAISRRDEETQPFRTALDPDGLEGRLAGALREASALGIEMYHLGLSPAAISIQGAAPNVQVIEAFSERLREQDWVVQSESSGSSPEGRPQFILKGMLRHEG